MFTAPTDTVIIAGQEYRLTANLHAYMELHELLREQPLLFRPVYNEEGQSIGGRLAMDESIAAHYLFAFHPAMSIAEWQAVVDRAHPKEIVNAWLTADQLITLADWDDEDGAGDSPFCPEPEEPLASA